MKNKNLSLKRHPVFPINLQLSLNELSQIQGGTIYQHNQTSLEFLRLRHSERHDS